MLTATEHSALQDLHVTKLGAALMEMGVPVRVAPRPEGPGPIHFHFGNGYRSLLAVLARRRGDLVTLHDVVPRARWLRYLLTPVQTRVFARHQVVVHSQYSAELLRAHAPNLKPVVIPLSLLVNHDRGARASGREGGESGSRVAVMPGRLVRAKGVGEVVEAARFHPELQVVLMGRALDRATERSLSSLPDNVIHVRADDDEDFLARLASADFVISMKRVSVGEASGPVVQAHLLGTPVAGLRVGSLPEYCGPGDIVMDPSSTASDLLAAISEAPLVRIPPDDPRCFTMADAARRYAELYRELGWW